MTKINKKRQHFSSLAGQFLVAMPTMDDLRFEHTVIFIYHHSPKHGAMGVVINRPADKMSLKDIVEYLHIPNTALPAAVDVLMGGPEDLTRGFILHSADYRNDETTLATPEIGISSNQQALLDLAEGRGPTDFLVLLGCAVWAPGQLEEEIIANVWLTAPARKDILFHTSYEKRWDEALHSIGITPAFLSLESGNV